MLDLDKYLKQSINIKLNGQVVEVLQPTARMVKEIGLLEKSITEENFLEMKSKAALLILNNNASGKKFTLEDVDDIPFKLQDLIIKQLTEMVYEAEKDPN